MSPYYTKKQKAPAEDKWRVKEFERWNKEVITRLLGTVSEFIWSQNLPAVVLKHRTIVEQLGDILKFVWLAFSLLGDGLLMDSSMAGSLIDVERLPEEVHGCLPDSSFLCEFLFFSALLNVATGTPSIALS